jgi:uridine kinase
MKCYDIFIDILMILLIIHLSYIFPYQNSADYVFNSALDYELSALKIIAEPQLKLVKPDNEKCYSDVFIYLFIFSISYYLSVFLVFI